jgi:hypothetical protein
MRTANLASQSLRHAETGTVWEEQLSGATGTVNMLPFTTFRVRATGATTVTIDGILAATMTTGEIIIFNAGSGVPGAAPYDTKPINCVIVIGGAAAFLQTGRNNIRVNAST